MQSICTASVVQSVTCVSVSNVAAAEIQHRVPARRGPAQEHDVSEDQLPGPEIGVERKTVQPGAEIRDSVRTRDEDEGITPGST